MKKTQKKLGNKGFSLVELIVVIAIMAVLVGVLAPTLIRNVEKSRESTDLQNLDSVRQAVITAMSNEGVAAEYADGGSFSVSNGNTAYNGAGASMSEEMSATLAGGITFKSSAAKGKVCKVVIDKNGKVSVGAYNAYADTAAIDCKRNTGKFISE